MSLAMRGEARKRASKKRFPSHLKDELRKNKMTDNKTNKYIKYKYRWRLATPEYLTVGRNYRLFVHMVGCFK